MSDILDRDLFRRIQDRVAVVGIGHLPFAKDIGRPISDTAVEAIQLALADAGLAAEDLDGMSMLEMEDTHEVSIARRLGVRQLTWWDKISYGGGASSATWSPWPASCCSSPGGRDWGRTPAPRSGSGPASGGGRARAPRW